MRGDASALGTEGWESSKESGMLLLEKVEKAPYNAEHQGSSLCVSSKSQDMAQAESVPDLPAEREGRRL